jgi:hypothetical protein
LKDIRAAAERIGREFRPHKIILFGSYAYGTPTADSDVDLLVILPFEGKPAYKATEIALKANPHFPMDLLARTPRQVRERLAMGDFFMREILEQGNRTGHFAVKEPHLLAVCLVFLCAVWDLKRWNLRGYTLEAVINSLTGLVLNGIGADRAVEVQPR